MNKNKQVGYSCIIFCSFSISFFVLSIVNILFPISNFKMVILSVVALLFSLQQLLEADEEIDSKITDLEKRSAHQIDLLDLIDRPTEASHTRQASGVKSFPKSKLIFAIAMIIMVIGLAIDIDIQSAAIANTLTILSFAAIFLTMGFKEMFMERINRLDEEIYEDDQRIIARLKDQISTMEKL